MDSRNGRFQMTARLIDGWLAPEATMVSSCCHLAVNGAMEQRQDERLRDWFCNGKQMMSQWPVLFHESTRILRLDLFTLHCQQTGQTQDIARSCSSRDSPPFPGFFIETKSLDPHPLQVGVIDIMSALCCTYMLQAGPHLCVQTIRRFDLFSMDLSYHITPS